MILLDLKNMKVGDEILWVGSGENSEQSNPIVASHHTIVTNKTASEFSINDWKDIKSELVWRDDMEYMHTSTIKEIRYLAPAELELTTRNSVYKLEIGAELE